MPSKYNRPFLEGAVTHEDMLTVPLTWKKPRTVFVNSMSDLFHQNVPDEFIDKVYSVMGLCQQHTFIILTKRPERMAQYYESRDDASNMEERAEILACTYPELVYTMNHYKPEKDQTISFPTNNLLPHIKQAGWYSGIGYINMGGVEAEKELEFIYEGEWPLKNVWTGTSVEDQMTANERIPFLLKVPSAVRFLSCEPLLGPINLKIQTGCEEELDSLAGLEIPTVQHRSIKPREVKKIDWVIAGGESGNKARPVHPDWVRSLRDQCAAAGTPFFFKQWGEYYTRWQHLGNHKPVFKMYESYLQFTQKLWVHERDKCVDAAGKECKIGQDFMNATYPVAIMTKVGKHNSGHLLDGEVHHEFPEGKLKA